MKRKTEPPPYRPPNGKESSEITKRRTRTRNRQNKAPKPEKQPEQVKLIINLNRCSQNWKTVIPELPPKLAFKRQSLKKKPTATSKTTPTTETKTATNTDKKIWFDVDKSLLPDAEESTTGDKDSRADDSVQITDEFMEEKNVKITKTIAIDCEMVGVGENGKDSILARVSLVNTAGQCFYDKHVVPTEKVTDYRTAVSGVRPDDLKEENGAISFTRVQKEVTEFLDGRILVGHAVHNDLQVLFVSHPKKKTRDTQKNKLFRRMHKSIGSLASLKNLAKLLLGLDIQQGEHSSVKDAQVTMRLYTTFKKEWEADLHNRKVEANEEKAAKGGDVEQAQAAIKNGEYKMKSEIEIKTGNETHKRYLQNKLSKRKGFKSTKKFLK